MWCEWALGLASVSLGARPAGGGGESLGQEDVAKTGLKKQLLPSLQQLLKDLVKVQLREFWEIPLRR